MINIFNDDCIKGMQTIPDESIDLVITDPPYLINYKTNHRKNKQHDFCSAIANDSNPLCIAQYIKELARIMKNNTAGYMFCSPDTIEFFKYELTKYFKIKNTVIWVKNNWTAGDLQAQFGKQYECIILFNKGRKKFNGKRLSDVWYFNRVSGKEQLHQNQKPYDLIEQCLLKHSNEGDLVFDGFVGSGTTALACKNNQRHFLGFELNPQYFNIAVKRIK